jgi:hypothetical protein
VSTTRLPSSTPPLSMARPLTSCAASRSAACDEKPGAACVVWRGVCVWEHQHGTQDRIRLGLIRGRKRAASRRPASTPPPTRPTFAGAEMPSAAVMEEERMKKKPSRHRPSTSAMFLRTQRSQGEASAAAGGWGGATVCDCVPHKRSPAGVLLGLATAGQWLVAGQHALLS